jgi:hypothetical protein
MKTEVRVLGAYQVIAGVFSLVTLYSIISARGFVPELLLLAASALSIIAGALLWERKELGWRLTIANQATQVIGVQLPFFSFSIVQLASAIASSTYVAKSTFAQSLFSTSAGASIFRSTCDLYVGRQPAGVPTLGISLNLVAIVVFFYAVALRNKANQSTDPMPESVTPVVGQPECQP